MKAILLVGRSDDDTPRSTPAVTRRPPLQRLTSAGKRARLAQFFLTPLKDAQIIFREQQLTTRAAVEQVRTVLDNLRATMVIGVAVLC